MSSWTAWFALLVAAPAHAGVWVRPEGEAWLQGSVSVGTSSAIHGPDGALLDPAGPDFLGDAAPLFEDARYVGVDLGAYGELGVGHDLEVVASLPAKYASNRWTWAVGDNAPVLQDNLGLGDLTAGARYGRLVHGVALSVYAGGRLPLYDNNPFRLNTGPGNSDFYDDKIPLGQGTIDGEALIGIGTGTGLVNGWALLEGGVRVRNRGYSTAIPARLQWGIKPEPVAAWVGASGVLSLGDGDAPDAFIDEWGKGPTVPDNSSWLTVDAGVLLPVRDGWSILVAGSQVVTGARFPSLTQGTVGLAWSGHLLEIR